MNAFVTVYVARKIGRKRVITRDEFYTVRGALSRKRYRSMRSFETFLREKGRGRRFLQRGPALAERTGYTSRYVSPDRTPCTYIVSRPFGYDETCRLT